jgi:hypothetical protein
MSERPRDRFNISDDILDRDLRRCSRMLAARTDYYVCGENRAVQGLLQAMGVALGL